MSIRLWNLEETAAFLNLEEKEVRTLVTAGELPCVQQGSRMLFDPEEVDAWYSNRLIRRIALPPRTRKDTPRALLDYCRPETMAPTLPGRTKPAILKELTALAENAGLLYDPAEFLDSLRKREELSSTAMAEGIALVHPLARDEYTCQEPFLAVAHSQSPVFFGEPSGVPTDLFFLLCSPDPEEHLHILAQLCQLATSKEFLLALRQATTPQEMMAAFPQPPPQ
ncbi:MAG: PTS sugar transporter subunit IIA [Oligosphaeraceae bacterium]